VPRRAAPDPGRPGTREEPEPGGRSIPMRTLKTTKAYARYLLTSLATVAFGLNLN
jgi:hypothetical protein